MMFVRGRPNSFLVLIATLLMVGNLASAQQGSAQLFLTGAVPDPNSAVLTISGGNFGSGGIFGTRPFVTLDLVPLDVNVATDSVILAGAPAGAIPPGTYLLSVSRGPTPAENASLDVTVGAIQPRRDKTTSSVQQDGKPSDAATDTSRSPSEGLPALVAGKAPAARVGDRVISVEVVDREWRHSSPSMYLRMLRQLYDARQQVLNTMVADELLAREAATRGVTVEALLAEEVPQHVIPMPDSAVISLFISLGSSARGATLEQMRPALRAWLQRHSEPELAKMSYVEELKKVSTRVDIFLDAPRVQTDRSAQDIALGPLAAQVEIVAFGDFQSAEYTRFAQAFTRIRDTFGDRIRLVFKNLPTLGSESAAAAEAGLCANAQGKFWAYHDALVARGPVNRERLTESAAAAGVDRETFKSCVERHEFGDAIQRASGEADRFGIQASPSFLVNGRLAPPPPPFLAAYDYFKLLVEEDLGWLASNRGR
jgi:protein-disulfide isomerase